MVDDQVDVVVIAPKFHVDSILYIDRWQDGNCFSNQDGSPIRVGERPVACGGFLSVQYTLLPEIAAVRAYLATEGGWRLRMATTRRRESELDGHVRLAFGCPGCGAPLGGWSRRRQGGALPGVGANLDVVPLETTVTLPGPVAADRPHWCYPPDGAFCDE
jgi:hypothetical protein